MTDLRELEPSAWMEDGVLVRAAGARREAHRLPHKMCELARTVSVAAVVGLAVFSTCGFSGVAVVSEGPAVVASPTSSEFASTKSPDDVDPRVWGQLVSRLKRMDVVYDQPTDNDPEPFIQVSSVWLSQELDPEGLSQGDLVDDLVFGNFHPIQPVQKHSTHGKSGWLSQDWRSGADGVCSIVASARRSMALVLSHSCDIDKKQGKSRVLAAPVQAISGLSEAQQQAVLEQRRIALFPLVGTPRGDLYADLRLAMALDQRLFQDGNRIASMSEEGRDRLHAQLVMLFTRRTGS